jgi:hypothetical protein
MAWRAMKTSSSIESINTLFPKIKKYQPAPKPRRSFENTLNRANSTHFYQQQNVRKEYEAALRKQPALSDPWCGVLSFK